MFRRSAADYRSDSEVSVYDSSEDDNDSENMKENDSIKKRKEDKECARTRVFRYVYRANDLLSPPFQLCFFLKNCTNSGEITV